MKIQKLRKNITRKAGVYFLYDKDLELIYIGESGNIKKRISQHTKKNSLKIKYFSYILVEESIMRYTIESLFIRAFEPKYNYFVYSPEAINEMIVYIIELYKEHSKKELIEFYNDFKRIHKKIQEDDIDDSFPNI